MIDRFHHVLIVPRNYEESLVFYRDALNYSIHREWGGNGLGRGVILSGGAMKVVLTEHAPDSAFEPARSHVLLDIHDIDARFKSLPKEAEVVMEPQDTPWGTRWFVLRDPDGNLLAFEEVHRFRHG